MENHLIIFEQDKKIYKNGLGKRRLGETPADSYLFEEALRAARGERVSEAYLQVKGLDAFCPIFLI
ncbi:MAG: hypothetical protein ABF651_11110 [Sporolactobacillus sp.]